MPKPKPQSPSKEDIFLAELRTSAQTVIEHAATDPSSPRPRLYADLVCAVLPDPPTALTALAQACTGADRRKACKEGLGHIASILWQRASQLDVLTAERAGPIALRMAPCIAEDAVLFFYAEQARGEELDEAAGIMDAVLDARSPSFRARARTLPITRALLEAGGFDLKAPGLSVRFHDNGHLARFASSEVELVLSEVPGSGRYNETGKRGGYGFAVGESYRDGAAHGVLCSPWHDGEEYTTKTAWLVWALQCVGTIRDGARAEPSQSSKPLKKKKKSHYDRRQARQRA